MEHKPCTVVAKVVCYLLHYLFLSCKIIVLLASSHSFRSECLALLTCNSSCHSSNRSTSITSDDHVTTGLPLLQTNEALIKENSVLSNEICKVNNCQPKIEGNGCKMKSSKVKTGILVNAAYSAPTASISNSCSLATASRMVANLIPQPPPPVPYQYSTLNKTSKNNAMLLTSTLPLNHPFPVSSAYLLGSLQSESRATAASPKPEEVTLSTTVIENGAPCIKIFSMTSV